MKVTGLELASFRGIQSLSLEFQNDVTVLAGLNGSGKSTVLSALATLLSLAARDLTPSRDKPRPFERSDISNEAAFLSAALSLEVEGQAVRVSAIKSRELPLVDRDETPEDKRYSRDKASQKLVRVDDEGSVEPLRQEQGTSWARFQKAARSSGRHLAVFYSTRRGAWSDIRTLSAPKSPSAADGFRGALGGGAIDLRDFAFWLHVAQVRQFKLQDAAMMRQAVEQFLPGMSNLHVQVEERGLDDSPWLEPRLLIDKGSTTLDLNQLSDGERGVLAIVLDLSRRLSRLGESPATGEAVVLIDEIDLHLHPRLQREVMDRLHATFPLCQFIVTTHSPQVIGQTRPEKLFYLERSGGKVTATRKAEFKRQSQNRKRR